ncbi:MAG TPA: 2-C-methyl-D-erythritol 4-phosphate cytidylyltransferase [Candidatus Dietzia merdigallinarum]|nr:2-C-methyl-D-erythritol 4-phosphate cytidylyltransferase [Candidatus Dietzia merdigallinarum]
MAAVVPAAGSGVRLGAGMPKAFVELDGRTMLVRSVEGLLESGVVDDVVAVVPEDRLDEAESLLAPLRGDDHVVVVTTGGAERTDSVRNGLAALTTAHLATSGGSAAGEVSAAGAAADGVGEAGAAADAVAGAAVYDVLLVHDAARCLTPAQPIRRVVEAVRAGEVAVVPVVPVVDTVKQVDAAGHVVGTPDRSALRAVQTPQGFAPAVLLAAYDAAGDVATDDAGLVERLGRRVATVEGAALAFKVTTAEDRMRAEFQLLSAKSLAEGPQTMTFGWRPYRSEPGSRPGVAAGAEPSANPPAEHEENQ